MRRPYHRTLWTYLHLQEIERIDDLKRRGQALHEAGLIAIAFHEPKRLTDEYHRLMDEMGMLPTQDEAIERVQSVIAAMEAVHAGTLATSTVDPTKMTLEVRDDVRLLGPASESGEGGV